MCIRDSPIGTREPQSDQEEDAHVGDEVEGRGLEEVRDRIERVAAGAARRGGGRRRDGPVRHPLLLKRMTAGHALRAGSLPLTSACRLASAASAAIIPENILLWTPCDPDQQAARAGRWGRCGTA